MQKSALLTAILREIYRHDFGTYVEDPPPVRKRHCRRRLPRLQEAPSIHE
jgi:hypothetical protein